MAAFPSMRWRRSRRPESRKLTRGNVPTALLGDGGPGALPAFSPRAALTVAEVYACVRVLAGAASALPLKTYRAGTERVHAADAQIARLIGTPWPAATTSDLVGQLMTSLVLTGDGLVGVWRDEHGLPVQLGLLPPDQVEVRQEHGDVVFLLGTADGPVRLTVDDVIHVRSPLALPGALRGCSPIVLVAAAMGEARSLGVSGASFANHAARPGALVKLSPDAARDETTRETVRVELEKRFSGKGAGRPAILGGIDAIEPLTLDLASRQFIEHREFAAGSVARVLGVPANLLDLSSGDSLTYSNTMGRSADFARFSLTPWLVAIERAFTGSSLARGVSVEFDLRGLLRGTAAERAEVYTAALNDETGWMTRAEVRAAENLPAEPTTEVGA